MKNLSVLFLILMALSTTAIGQSIPIGAMPIQYNGSFAGSAGDSRISSHALYYGYNDSFGEHSNSWGKRRSYGLFTSFDRFFPGIRSGVGITISRYSDLSEQGGDSWFYKYNTAQTVLKLDIAPKFSIKGKYTISPSIGFQVYKNDIKNEPDLGPEFPNGIDYTMGGSFGILFNADQYYIGYSMSIFHSDFESISFRSQRAWIQCGYTFQRNSESKFSFTPQVMILIKTNDDDNGQNIISNSTYNLGFRYGQFIAGIINNLRNEFVPSGFQLGWQNNGWRILTSHEFDFRYYKTYSPSLSLRYIFNHEKKSVRIYDQSF